MAKKSYSYVPGGMASFPNAPFNYSRPELPPKYSGCSIRIKEDGAPILFGWKTSRQGLLRFYARPYKKTKKITSKSGKEWLNLFVTITNINTMQQLKTSGLYNKANQKLYIKEFNLIANPKAPRGGYFGKHISRTYNR